MQRDAQCHTRTNLRVLTSLQMMRREALLWKGWSALVHRQRSSSSRMTRSSELTCLCTCIRVAEHGSAWITSRVTRYASIKLNQSCQITPFSFSHTHPFSLYHPAYLFASLFAKFWKPANSGKSGLKSLSIKVAECCCNGELHLTQGI